MAQLIVLYATPPDSAAFDKHYAEVHIPLVKKLPGLSKFEVSQTPVPSPMGPSPFYMAATLHYPDLETLKTSMGTPEGKAAGDDAMTFFAPGSQLLMMDNHEV